MDSLAICQKIKKFVALWNFSIGVSGKLKCGISQKWLIVEQNGGKFGTRSTTMHTCLYTCIGWFCCPIPCVLFGVIQCTNFRFHDFRIHELCLTMSAELMKSKFIRRPSVCGINYLWTCCMDSFKILASAGTYARPFFFFNFEKHWGDFLRIFFIFVSIEPYMGAKTLKRYSSLKSLANLFKLFLNFLLSGPYKSTLFEFWNLDFPIFNEFLNFTIVPMGKPKTSIICKMSDRGEKRSEIWASGESIQVYRASLTVKSVRSFSAFPIFDNLVLQMAACRAKWSANLGLKGDYSVYTGYFWQLSA